MSTKNTTTSTKKAEQVKEYNNEKRMVLFINDKCRPGTDDPKVRGYITLKNKTYKISGWAKVSSEGKKYIQCDVNEEGTANAFDDLSSFGL